MSVSEQVQYENSTISTFLRQQLPQLPEVAATWGERLTDDLPIDYVEDAHPPYVGHSLELRLDLDRSSGPSNEKLLRCLPPNACRFVLQASGLAVAEGAFDENPMNQAWHREQQPRTLDGDLSQQIVLNVCYFLGMVKDMAMQIRPNGTDERYVNSYICLQRLGAVAIAPTMLRSGWQQYLEKGRDQLNALGETKHIAPVFAPGFATGDLIEGETLLDVKAQKEPKKEMLKTARQVVAYALLDRTDQFGIRAVGMYSAYHGEVVHDRLDTILAAATKGASSSLSSLRDELHGRLHKDLINAERWERTGIW